MNLSQMTYEKKMVTGGGVCEFDTIIASNCPMGGDAGHGGKTVFRIENYDFTNFKVTQGEGWVDIEVGGDAECKALMDIFSSFALGLARIYSVNAAVYEKGIDLKKL